MMQSNNTYKVHLSNLFFLFLFFLVIPTNHVIGQDISDPTYSFKRVIPAIENSLSRKEKKIIGDIIFLIDEESSSKTAYATIEEEERIIYIDKDFLGGCVNMISSLFIDSLLLEGFHEFYIREYYNITKKYDSPIEILALDSLQADSFYYQPLESDIGGLLLLQTVNFIVLHEIAHHVLDHPRQRIEVLGLVSKDEIYKKLKSFEFEADIWAKNKLHQNVFFEINIIQPIITYWTPDFILSNKAHSTMVGERMLHLIKDDIDRDCQDEFTNGIRCENLNNQLKRWNFINTHNSQFNSSSGDYILNKLPNLLRTDSSYTNAVDVSHFVGLSYLQGEDFPSRLDSALYYFIKGANMTNPVSKINSVQSVKFESPKEMQEKCMFLSALIFDLVKNDMDAALQYYRKAESISLVFPKWLYQNRIKRLENK